MGGLLLFIVAEIFLRVLIGTEARVQLDGDILAGVVVLHGHLTVALVYGPEVGLQQLTVQAQRIGLGGLGQFLAAGGLLADGTVVHVVHSLVQFAALLPQAFGAVLGGVVVLQQFAVAGVLGQQRGAAVLLRHKEAELHRLGHAIRLGQAHRRGGATVGMFGLQLIDGGGKLGFFVNSQVAGQRRGLAQSAADGLPHDNRADTRHGLAQGLGDGQVLLAGSGHHGGGAGNEEVRPGGLGRQRVGQTGQQLADLAVLKIHTLEGIDDAAVLHQHQVGVASHQLRRHGVHDQVAHLVGAAEVKVDDAVARLPAQIDQAAAGQMLAQQHAEARGRKRVFKVLLGQADACRPAAGRQQQPVGLCAGAQRHQHFVSGRLKDLIDLGIQQGGFQFPGYQRQGRSIKRHGFSFYNK